MTRQPIWDDSAAAELLHILPQSTYHDDAEIYGSPDALRRLGEALIRAADDGQSRAVPRFMARDGEGYAIRIMPRDQWSMEAVPMPYAQLGHPWDFTQEQDR